MFRRRAIVAETDEERAIEAAGGEYEAVSPIALRAELQEFGVRAVRLVNASLLAEVAGLEQIEFLKVGFGLADPAPIETLPGLRSLHINGWAGRLDFSRLPNLEWLVIAEARAADGLESLLAGHPTLRDVWMIFYERPDLRAIGDLPSPRRLSFKQCKLKTLAGIDGASGLTGLTLERCASLNSLAGIEGCPRLEYLRVQFCPRLRDLSPLAADDRLRMLDVESMPNIESLRPLAGHPGLEVLYFSKIADRDLDPLASLPGLKLVRARGEYNRDAAEFNRVGTISRTDPIFRGLRRLVNP